MRRPARDEASADVSVLSLVVSHEAIRIDVRSTAAGAVCPDCGSDVPDRARAARELARVLRTGGTAIVRTTFRERLDAVVYDYWSQLLATGERRFPGEEEVVADFASAGFTLREDTSFAQPVAADLAEYHARPVGRSQSKFTHLTEEECRSGLLRLETAARAEASEEPRPWPVLERYDVAVFSRSWRGSEKAPAAAARTAARAARSGRCGSESAQEHQLVAERRRGGGQQAPRVRVLCGGEFTALGGALDERSRTGRTGPPTAAFGRARPVRSGTRLPSGRRRTTAVRPGIPGSRG